MYALLVKIFQTEMKNSVKQVCIIIRNHISKMESTVFVCLHMYWYMHWYTCVYVHMYVSISIYILCEHILCVNICMMAQICICLHVFVYA